MSDVSKYSAKRINIIHKSGDDFSKMMWRKKDLIAVDPDVQIPGNLTGSLFRMQVRVVDLANTVLVDITDEFFSLGQSQAAIDYDIAEDNEPGTTLDELYFEVPGEMFRFVPGSWQWDLEWIDVLGKVHTPLYGDFILNPDVTREGSVIA